MSTEIQQSELRNDNVAIMRRVAAAEVAAMAKTSPLSTQQADDWMRDIREGRYEEPEDPWTGGW